MSVYPGEERPKHHLRLHLPAMYTSLGYADCWATEKKHGMYKRFLADTLQHVWKERSGDLSRQVLGRMLHQTIESQNDSAVGKSRLAGRVYKPQQVEEACGVRCSVSTRVHTGHQLLNAGDVLLWRRGAGMILFCADWRNQFVVVMDVLVPLSCDIPHVHALRFSLSGAKDAVCLQNLEQLRKPAWWLVEQSSVLCLL